MNSEKIVCPVDRTLNLISKKWSIQIIRDMFFGKKHFKEFKEDKPKLSNKVLSGCLKDLEENGLIEYEIEKKVLNTTPITTEYYLTEYGRSMNRIIYELAMFTLDDELDDNYPEDLRNELKNNFKETLEIDD